MRYELYMSHALSQAAASVGRGERGDGAVAVLDDAMVASASDQVRAEGDPTAHAVMVVIREASARLRRSSLTGVTVYCVVEPCTMCIGALLQADADGVVFALHDPMDGACGTILRAAQADGPRLRVVSGILQDQAADVRPDLRLDRATAPRRSSAIR
jgi:tRNA(adenine34) deaminase